MPHFDWRAGGPRRPGPARGRERVRVRHPGDRRRREPRGRRRKTMAQRGAKRKTTAAQGPTARDLMTKDPIVARLPGTRTEVLRLLVTHRLTGVPVARKDRSLAGLVTRHHIFAKPLEEQLAKAMDGNRRSTEGAASLTEVAT